MRIVVIDFETLYSDEYTLSKMSTEAYIRDPRFESYGAAVKWSPSVDARWYTHPELQFHFKQEDWSDAWIICHHAQFDGLILTHHYDVHPKMWGCTLSMARGLLGNHISVSLDSVRKQFGIAPKITPYQERKGKHWNELSPAMQQMLADGAVDEVESKNPDSFRID